MGKKQSNDKIKEVPDFNNKKNAQLTELNTKMENEIKEYLPQGSEIQQKYMDDIRSIGNIQNVKQCEKIINRLAKDIPKYMTMDEAYPLLKDLLKITEEDRELQDAEIELRKKSHENFKIMVETIYPSLILSKDKRDFLWNLATWKSNLLLTKQMKKYTFVVMILTIIVVITTILSVYISFIK